MFGKCLVYELKLTWKKMCLIYMIAAIALLCRLIFYTTYDYNDTTMLRTLSFTTASIFTLAESLLSIITVFVLCRDYRTTMYSSRGYLTHTLPIKTMTIFWGKIVNAIIWTLATCLLQFFLFVYTSLIVVDGAPTINTLFDRIGDILAEIPSVGVFFMILALIILMTLYTMFVVAACYGVGQLSDNHRVAFTILAGFGFYILTIFVTASLTKSIAMNYSEHLTGTMILARVDITLLIACIAIYILNRWLLTKKLNLQ